MNLEEQENQIIDNDSIDNNDKLEYTETHPLTETCSINDAISESFEIPNTSKRPNSFVGPTNTYTARSPSLVYLKPCFITPRHSTYDDNEDLYQLYCEEPYPNVVPFSLVDENGICYAALPHGRTIDLSSLYYKGNGSPIFDLQETQSPKEKRIAKIVMAVAVILLTMCVVLVGVTLSMSGYIDSMVRELHSKRNINPINVNDPLIIPRYNDSTKLSINNITKILDQIDHS